MNSYTVFGHVLADKLPTHTTVIGDGWLRYLPNAPLDGGGPTLQHPQIDQEANYASTTPAHMMIHSYWQVGFRNIVAPNEEDAVERVRRTKIPQFQAAYYFATGDQIEVVLSGILKGMEAESRSPWSYTATVNIKAPSELSLVEITRANSVVDLLKNDPGASRAASLLSQAEWRMACSGGIVAFQAAAVVDAVQAIERIAQAINKNDPPPLLEPAEDPKVQNYLSALQQAFSEDADVVQQLRIVKKISTRALEVLDRGTIAKLKHASDLLGLAPKEFNKAKRLWTLRSSKLAHPGKLPEQLDQEAREAIVLGRTFLNAYLERLILSASGSSAGMH